MVYKLTRNNQRAEKSHDQNMQIPSLDKISPYVCVLNTPLTHDHAWPPKHQKIQALISGSDTITATDQ